MRTQYLPTYQIRVQRTLPLCFRYPRTNASTESASATVGSSFTMCPLPKVIPARTASAIATTNVNSEQWQPTNQGAMKFPRRVRLIMSHPSSSSPPSSSVPLALANQNDYVTPTVSRVDIPLAVRLSAEVVLWDCQLNRSSLIAWSS